MPNLSRRDLLRASAGAAAVAVPIGALANSPDRPVTRGDVDDAALSADSTGPVMFAIHDANRGEVSVLHGTSEVIVTDRSLVTRILAAARTGR